VSAGSERSAVAAEVAEFMYGYANAVDQRDAAGIRALLADDVQLSRNGDTVRGADAFMESYRPFLVSDALGSRHSIGNIVVEQTDIDTVTVRAAFEATVFRARGTTRIFGHYQDDLRRSDSGWVFGHKRNFMEWSVPLPPATSLSPNSGEQDEG